MGIWRSHHSIGNIFGTILASAFVEYNWGLSFAVPAAVIIGFGILLFLFMVPDPRAVGCQVPDHSGKAVRLLIRRTDRVIWVHLLAL